MRSNVRNFHKSNEQNTLPIERFESDVQNAWTFIDDVIIVKW